MPNITINIYLTGAVGAVQRKYFEIKNRNTFSFDLFSNGFGPITLID